MSCPSSPPRSGLPGPAGLALVLATAACARPPSTVAPPTSAAAPADPKAPRPMTGSYLAPHTIMMVCGYGDDDGDDDGDVDGDDDGDDGGGGGGWCEEEVTDHMDVREADGEGLAVSIELVRTNAHTCSFEGVLVPDPRAPAPTRRWVFQSDDELEGPCTLQLEQSGRRVDLHADGCRYYCGARASLDATFRFPPGPLAPAAEE
jgi:hypothetical protein